MLIRANHRCEYRSDEGTRCSARSGLQIDHIIPWALGGRNEEENLRVLCVAHNRWYADQSFGPGFMIRKIESARIERAQLVGACERGNHESGLDQILGKGEVLRNVSADPRHARPG